MKNKVNLRDLKAPYYLEQTFSYACGLGIDLKKSGAFYVASCPFHSDTKPSFYLHDKKGKVHFTCFSNKCEGSWDIFDLIQKIEGCDFITAVKQFGQHLSIEEVILPQGEYNKMLMDRNELLVEAYEHLKWALLSKGKFEINRSIRRRVRYLTELYGISSEDLLHDIFEMFLAKKHYEKFNAAKGKPSTFMTHYANLSLLNIIKKYNRLNSNNKKVSLPDDYEDTFNQKWRYSLSHLEKIDFSDGLVERKSPEDLYLAKELYEKMEEFFGKDDFEVLQGDRTRSEEARRKGIDYETYRKRLYRRKLDFLRGLDNGD